MSAESGRMDGARSFSDGECLLEVWSAPCLPETRVLGTGDSETKKVGWHKIFNASVSRGPWAMPSHPWSSGTRELWNSGAAITKVKVVKSSRLKMQMPRIEDCGLGIADCGLRQVRPPPP